MSEERRKIGTEEVDSQSGVLIDTDEFSESKKRSKKPLIIVIVIIAVLAALVGAYFLLCNYGVLDNIFEEITVNESEMIAETGRFYNGVHCMGVDLSNADRNDATVDEQLNKAKSDIISGINYTVKFGENTVNVCGEDMGADIDIEACKNNSFAYGREGSVSDRKTAIINADTASVDIDYEITIDTDKLNAYVDGEFGKLDVSVSESNVNIIPVNDEDKLTTSLTVEPVGEAECLSIDYDDLDSTVSAGIAAKEFVKDVEPLTMTTTTTLSQEDFDNIYCKQGTFRTTFSTSNSNRKYNIWKMASIINGNMIQPGETWSINEQAGPRTYSRGWKAASGISNGQYQQEAGGGICQVSTTLYNACLKTEIEIVDRSHHSWPSEYVDPGLDATISTGSPDFKIKNPYDTPIIICAECSASESFIEVSIYCPKMDHTWEYTSDVVSRSYSGARNNIPDPTMPVGTEKLVQKEHPRVVANVYKQKMDLQGQPVGEKELAYTDTYSNMPAIYNVGTMVVDPVVPEQPVVPEPDPAQPTDPTEPTTDSAAQTQQADAA